MHSPKHTESAIIGKWLSLEDIETNSFTTGTWVPLHARHDHPISGQPGDDDYSHEYLDIETLILFKASKQKCGNIDWHSLNTADASSAWANDEVFHSPGYYYLDDTEDKLGLYPVIKKNYLGEPHTHWYLNQEIIFKPFPLITASILLCTCNFR